MSCCRTFFSDFLTATFLKPAAVFLAIGLAFLTLPTQAQTSAPQPSFGVAFAPANSLNFSEQDILNALGQVQQLGGHVSFIWNWSTLRDGVDGKKAGVDYMKSQGIPTIIQLDAHEFGVVEPPLDVAGTSFADPDLRQRFIDDVVILANMQPDYLVINLEINLIKFLNPQEFEHFKTLYQQAYDIAKQTSPQTKVGTSFLYRLFAGLDERTLPDEVGSHDFVGLTTYPSHLINEGVYSAIGDVPPEYYGWARTALPNAQFVMTEIGWSSLNLTPKEQAAYVAEIPRLFSLMQPEFLTWSLLHDLNYFDAALLDDQQLAYFAEIGVDPGELYNRLNTVGLRNYDGTPKPAWDEALLLDFSVWQTPTPPLADAGPDRSVTDTDNDGLAQVTLDGSGSNDPDGGAIASYVWSEGGIQIATGVAPAISLAVGTHEITLTVTDDEGDSATDLVSITVQPASLLPVAAAGIDQSVTDTDGDGLAQVTLDGSGSNDPDGGAIASYVWSEGGIDIATGATPLVSLAVGAHEITLTVTDDEGDSATDLVSVTVQPASIAPVANAGPDQSVTDTDNDGLAQVTLNGSGSNDPDGGAIASYVWSEGGIQIAMGVAPAISLAVGTHNLTLTVTDDEGDSATDLVSVTVQPAPVAAAAPSIAQCAPNSGYRGQRLTVQVTGSDLQNGAVVDFGSRVTVQGVTFVSASRIDVSIRIHYRAASGARTVTVVNPDGQSGTATACFTVN